MKRIVGRQEQPSIDRFILLDAFTVVFIHSDMAASHGPKAGLQLSADLTDDNMMVKADYDEMLARDVATVKYVNRKIRVKLISGYCFGVESKELVSSYSVAVLG